MFQFSIVAFDFLSIYLIHLYYASGLDSASNRMSTRNLPGGKGRPARKVAVKLSAICKPIVYKMWDSRRLTTLYIFTAYSKDPCLGLAE
jgi:hypothetical protein